MNGVLIREHVLLNYNYGGNLGCHLSSFISVIWGHNRNQRTSLLCEQQEIGISNTRHCSYAALECRFNRTITHIIIMAAILVTILSCIIIIIM